jgi:transcriptional regulator with XRE-family HTH domain
MKPQATTPMRAEETPGEYVRLLRKRRGLTLSELSATTGLAVSTLSKLENGHLALSYDKLMLLSEALGVDMAQLLDSTPHAPSAVAGAGGRRVVQRSGEGQVVETQSYRQLYLATEILSKRFTPIVVELRARTMQEFTAEFGDFIRHPGEEFAMVLDGEVEFHTDLYAPVRLKGGDSVYFDSEMGHAYLKGSEGLCRIVASCSPRGNDDGMIHTFVNASEKLAAGTGDAGVDQQSEPRTRVRISRSG